MNDTAIRTSNMNAGSDNTGGNALGKRRSTSNGEDSTTEKTSLKVVEANSKDVGRRIARIDPKISEDIVMHCIPTFQIQKTHQLLGASKVYQKRSVDKLNSNGAIETL